MMQTAGARADIQSTRRRVDEPSTTSQATPGAETAGPIASCVKEKQVQGRIRGPLNTGRPSRGHAVLANERRPKLQAYPLVTIGAGALPLPTKQPPKLSAVTTSASASATFLIGSPLLLPFLARQ